MMRRVVLDTNCLLQMISRHSPYFSAWQAFDEGKYYLCISNDIINEYQEVITRLTNYIVAEHIVNFILNNANSIEVNPQFHFNLIDKDPDDNKFVDCAITANADYVVSEDNHFRVLSDISFPKVNVVSLADFIHDILS